MLTFVAENFRIHAVKKMNGRVIGRISRTRGFYTHPSTLQRKNMFLSASELRQIASKVDEVSPREEARHDSAGGN